MGNGCQHLIATRKITVIIIVFFKSEAGLTHFFHIFGSAFVGLDLFFNIYIIFFLKILTSAMEDPTAFTDSALHDERGTTNCENTARTSLSTTHFSYVCVMCAWGRQGVFHGTKIYDDAAIIRMYLSDMYYYNLWICSCTTTTVILLE